MAVRQDTIFEQFLAPIFRNFLLDEKAMQEFANRIDWEKASDRLTNPALIYPNYYKQQNFHGIEGGYLTKSAAVTYDPITQYVLPPGESLVRKALIDTVKVKPRRILDLGCGTGSTTVLLKQAFPNSEVIGLDLSPFMLVAAEDKAHQAGLEIQWIHAKAEQTGFPPESFDLVTASLLFHETPPAISQAILQESYRLLTVGGECLILDGNQRMLRQTTWLNNIFEEPYIRDYASGSVDAWMGSARFEAVQTHDVWWLNQLTQGFKSLQSTEPASQSRFETMPQKQWAMG